MGKFGHLFKSVSSDTCYMIARTHDLSVLGIDARGWLPEGKIALTAEALQQYVCAPGAVFSELKEKYCYCTNLDDERRIYFG